jgi:hypothetical protein
MAAITQRIANFLGGKSQQVDERLFPGQVRDAFNAYPDVTFGLSKRPGSRYINKLKTAAGTTIASGVFDNAAWFTAFRDNSEKYVGNVTGGQVSVWSLVDGVRKTVTLQGSASTYLTGGKDDFSFLTVNDYTFITNKSKTVAALSPTTVAAKTKATIRLVAVLYSSEYKVTINGTSYSTLTINADSNVGAADPAKKVLDTESILDALKTAITASGITVTKIENTLELSSSTPFTINVKGGQSGEALRVYQDTVDNISKLALETVHNRVVEVINSAANVSSYYVKFVATNGVSGPGYWEETVKPGISTGLDPSTMPHELVRNSDGSFTAKPVTWEPRLVGDDESNSHPSFVGNTIQQLFFYNNRIGFLSDDNVSMSQTGEYFNLYHTTAATLIASDPVDISCSSIKPALLHAVLPTAQGLLLFSQYQQFMMSSENGVWTPATVSIRVLSSYETNPLIQPVDLGTTVCFTSKNANYSRVFEMMTRGQNENPVVYDQTKIVSEWIPASVDQLISSPQNTLFSLAGRTSRRIYMYRFLDQGDERTMSSWVEWEMAGKVQHHAINSDLMHIISQHSTGYMIEQINLVQSPDTSALVSSTGSKVDPYLDMYSLVSGTYNSTTSQTKFYLPFPYDSTKQICLVVGSSGSSTLNRSGFVSFPTPLSDGGGYYVEASGDLSTYAVFLGYPFLYEIVLPKFYYRTQENADFAASLIMSRYQVYVGMGSNVDFSIKALGRSTWESINVSKTADYYLANDTPIDPYHIYKIPIHQRTENFTMKITSNLPFPVNLVSLVWEGQYSNRFYKRA